MGPRLSAFVCRCKGNTFIYFRKIFHVIFLFYFSSLLFHSLLALSIFDFYSDFVYFCTEITYIRNFSGDMHQYRQPYPAEFLLKSIMTMKRTLAIAAMTLALVSPLSAQIDFTEDVEARMSCTSIMVGKKASADGSVITSHTCDGNYRTWMDIYPGFKASRDTLVAVVKGRMHTDHSKGTRGMTVADSILVPGKAYSFLNTSYPCMNEKQLAMGETTIKQRDGLENPKGLFLIEELERIALQQCTTARDAIKLMGELVKKYGYGDGGECLTIADKNEVWQFEVFGEGKDRIGGVWAAVRIPDDEVGVSANIPRISKINLKDKDNCMASDNVFEVAKRLGFWDGKEPFKFWKAYGGGNYLGEEKAYSVRELFILDNIAPSLGLNASMEELPISVKPERKISAEDVMELLSSTYEGTGMDPIRNLKVIKKNKDGEVTDTVTSPAANPWMTRDMRDMLNALKPDAAGKDRTVAVPQCSYSTVIQLRDWLPDDVGGVAWVSFDNPAQSPRIPVFCGTTDLPDAFKIDGQLRFDPEASVWPFRRANKLATVRWGATKDEHNAAKNHFINKGKSEMPFVEATYKAILEKDGVEAAREFLTGYTSDFAGAAMAKWTELGNRYWTRFARGF